MADSGKGDMPVSKAGKLGGEKVKQKYGREYYEQIGQKGGRSRSAQRSGADE